jgi:hypothetical protein
MTKIKSDRDIPHSSFELRASFAIRHSCFAILSALILLIMTNFMQAQSPNLIGRWNVDVTFANQDHRSVRLEAQSDGKGTLTVTDPQSKVWAGTKPSDAKWTRDEGNSLTFSGPVEFLIGNVGRDAGILTCKGKFENPDLITGEVEFSPSVGEGPSKHGTFKAVRAVN